MARSVASMAGDTCRSRGTGTVPALGQRRLTRGKFHHFGLGEAQEKSKEVEMGKLEKLCGEGI